MENIDIFFKNTSEMKKGVIEDEEFMNRLVCAKRAFIDKKAKSLEGEEIRYAEPASNFPNNCGIKMRIGIGAQIEMAIMADLFSPDFLMPSYCIPFYDTMKEYSNEGGVYLVEHVGNVFNMDSKLFNELGGEGLKKYIDYIQEHGYKMGFDSFRIFGLREREKGLDFAMMDFGGVEFENVDEIKKGLTKGKGKFSRLSEIRERYQLSENNLINEVKDHQIRLEKE